MQWLVVNLGIDNWSSVEHSTRTIYVWNVCSYSWSVVEHSTRTTRTLVLSLIYKGWDNAWYSYNCTYDVKYFKNVQ